MDKVGAFASKKCLCCNNPWNGIEGVYPCSKDGKGFTGLDIDNIDNSVNPAENFYLYSNGNWIKNNPIPAEYPAWNTFTALFDQNLSRLKDILSELQETDRVRTDEEDKLANFYNSYMDEETIESRKIEPIISYLKLALSTNSSNLVENIVNLHAKGICQPFFGYYPSPDKKNSELTIPNITQGGLGLPDRDYYFDADKNEKRDFYIEFITNILNYIGEDSDISEYKDKSKNARIALAIFEYEKKLASAHLTKTECRDPELTYNLMTLSELNETTKPKFMSYAQYLARGTPSDGLDYVKFFTMFGNYLNISTEDFGFFNVSMVEYMKKVSELVDAAIVPHYLVFHIMKNNCDHLSKNYVNEKWLMFDNRLSGSIAQKDRWKKGLSHLEASLGEALGKIYVKKHFNEESKAKALQIVNLVLEELRARVNEVEWLHPSTKAEAIKKMDKFGVKIGYPDKFEDYAKLEIIKGHHLENVFASRSFDQAVDFKTFWKATDRNKWHMTPQTVNAYYHPNLNEIVFPSAILSPPFFDVQADDAINFGSFGAVVGHEMTHGFDDKGRKFDWKGEMRDWWQECDSQEYEKRSQVMMLQAENFEVYGQKLNGKLTQGENIADLGGLKLACRAMIKSLPQNPPLINGFTPQQRFFLAWSQCWRQNVTETRATQLLTLDPHGPNEFRANSPLTNMSEFFTAFNVTPTDKMYRKETDKVDIW